METGLHDWQKGTGQARRVMRSAQSARSASKKIQIGCHYGLQLERFQRLKPVIEIFYRPPNQKEQLACEITVQIKLACKKEGRKEGLAKHKD